MILSEISLSEYLLTFLLNPRYFPSLWPNPYRALARSTDERDWARSVRAVPARSLPAESIRRDEPVGCGQARKDDRRLGQPVQAPDSLAPLRWFRLSTDFLVLKEKPVLGTNIVACRLRSPENGKPLWQEADFASPFSAFTYSCKAGPKHLFLKMSTKVDCLSPAARRSGRATNRFLTL